MKRSLRRQPQADIRRRWRMTGRCIGRHRRLLGSRLLSQRLEFLLVSGCIFTPSPPLLYPPTVRQYPRHRRQHPSHDPDIFSWYFDQQPNQPRACVKSADLKFGNDQVFDMTNFDESGRWMGWTKNEFSNRLAMEPPSRS